MEARLLNESRLLVLPPSRPSVAPQGLDPSLVVS